MREAKVAIAASAWAYDKVLEKKRELEEERVKIVSMADALDALLKEKMEE